MSELLRTFGKGIQLASGFDLGAKASLDSRYVVETIAERDAHVTSNRAYEGMLVYVGGTVKTIYQLEDVASNKWKELGFNQDQMQGTIVNDLTTGGTDKVLSAEQGKVLKGLIDGVATDVEGVEAQLAEALQTINGQLANKVDTATMTAELAKKAEKAGSLEQDFNAKNVVIAGNLSVQGTTTTIQSENLEVKDNEITINKGEAGAGVSNGTAGIRVERGTETDYLFQFNEDAQMFQVGMEGDLETVATRPYVDAKETKLNAELAKKATVEALTAEKTRAEAQEAAIRGEFAQADTALNTKIGANTTAIETEVTRAKAAEGALTTEVGLKVAKADVYNNLDATQAGKVLDARQGKVLKDQIDAVVSTTGDQSGRLDAAETAIGTVDSRIATAKTGAVADAKTYTDTVAAGKADKSHEHEIAQVKGLQTKLTGLDTSISDLESADTVLGQRVDGLDTAVAGIDQIKKDVAANTASISKETTDRQTADTALGGRIDATNTEVAKKADTTTMTAELAKKVDKSVLFTADNKIDASLIPSIALTDTHVVDSEAEMLALKVQTGDVAIRTDISKTFILKGTDPTQLSNWTSFLTPGSPVTSVAGKTGDVTLSKIDVGLGNVTNESKATMLTNAALTGIPTAPTAAVGTNDTQVATTAFVKSQNYLTQESVIDGGTF